VKDVAGFMADHGYCAHCRTAAQVVGGLLSTRRESAEGRPEPSPRERGVFDPLAPHSPERAAIEGVLLALSPIADERP
jgi:hypothetical protein